MAAAIPRRRTDRRRHSSWAVPRGHVEAMAKAAAALEGTVLQVAEDSGRDYHLATAIEEASRQHADDPAYRTELAAWSGRHVAARRRSGPQHPGAGRHPGRAAGPPVRRSAPGPAGRRQGRRRRDRPAGPEHRLRRRMSRLRAGEATSAVLLTATAFGLSSLPAHRAAGDSPTSARPSPSNVTGGSYPQMVLRIGWAPANADPLLATPRRDLADVLQPLDAPTRTLPYQSH